MNLSHYERTSLQMYNFLRQGNVWAHSSGRRLYIPTMPVDYRYNCMAFLERDAANIAAAYGAGQQISMHMLQGIETLVERITGSADDGPSAQEGREAAYNREADLRLSDPVAWLRTLPLYQALAAGLPPQPRPDMTNLNGRNVQL